MTAQKPSQKLDGPIAAVQLSHRQLLDLVSDLLSIRVRLSDTLSNQGRDDVRFVDYLVTMLIRELCALSDHNQSESIH